MGHENAQNVLSRLVMLFVGCMELCFHVFSCRIEPIHGCNSHRMNYSQMALFLVALRLSCVVFLALDNPVVIRDNRVVPVEQVNPSE